MISYNFYNPDDGRTYSVRGPRTLTKDQAQKIFNDQKSVGALIGLKAGDSITPEFQLANGLKTAEASVLTDIKTRIQVNNSTGIVFPNVPVTNGITVASYAKQPIATGNIADMSRAEVTGVLAQVKNLTQQASNEATNLGAGKYALTVNQLERAGYIKPGTAASYLSKKTVSTLGILNSPVVWTGKNGIGSLDQLLQNESVQDTIQQELMSAGLTQIAEAGVSVNSLPQQRQAGLALLSAIDPDLAISWNNGTAPPVIATSGALPDGATSYWQSPDRIVRDAAYSTEFSNSKVDNAMRQEIVARGYTNLTERQAIDFAANQIVGNPKVPKISYGTTPVNQVLLAEFNLLNDQYSTVKARVTSVLSQTTSISNAATKEAQLIALRKELVPDQGLQTRFNALLKKAEVTAPVSQQFLTNINLQLTDLVNLVAEIDAALQFIARVLGKKAAV